MVMLVHDDNHHCWRSQGGNQCQPSCRKNSKMAFFTGPKVCMYSKGLSFKPNQLSAQYGDISCACGQNRTQLCLTKSSKCSSMVLTIGIVLLGID